MSEINNNESSSLDYNDMDFVDAPKNTKATIKRLLKVLSQQKVLLIFILLATLSSIALYAITPMIIGVMIDNLISVIGKGNTGNNFMLLKKAIGTPMLLLILAYALSSFFSFIEEYFMAGLGERFVLSIRKQISEKITKVPLSYYDSHQTGDLLSRVTNDLDRVAEVIKTGFLQFVSAVFNISISIAIMLSQSVFLTVLLLASMMISIFTTMWISNKNFKIASENQTVLGELNGKIEELFTGNLIVKSFNQQKSSSETVKEISQRQYKANKKAQFVLYAIYPAIRFLTQLSFVVTAIAGSIFVITGRITIGTIQAFLQYVNQISDPITQSSYFFNSLQSALASAERVFEFLDEEEEVADPVYGLVDNSIDDLTLDLADNFSDDLIDTLDDDHADERLNRHTGTVEFQHVRFGYSPDNILMNDISISINPNEMVAIVGPTGAGKTTLVNLLMRFYELNDGKILINGVDIKQIPKGKLRNMIGMVLQDTWLFKGSIAENIAYGRKDSTIDEIVQAAKAARCDHFIRTLKNGYNTVISSESGSISQGQMQLLTIARAMLANPSIMILDEATSSVDTRTEVEVQKAMAQVMRGKTSFVIAHRLSTIRSADKILVMKDGDIIEHGTHDELLSKDSYYAELYNSQFAQ